VPLNMCMEYRVGLPLFSITPCRFRLAAGPLERKSIAYHTKKRGAGNEYVALSSMYGRAQNY
jgi:hypothetical protein